MANKKRIFQAIISAVLFMAVGALIIALAPSKVKAYSASDKKPFTKLNIGYDNKFNQYYSNNDIIEQNLPSSYYRYYYEGTSQQTYYYVLIIPANTRVNSLFLSWSPRGISNMGWDSTINGHVLFEVGFINGDYMLGANLLENYYLPYYVPNTSYYDFDNEVTIYPDYDLTSNKWYVSYIDLGSSYYESNINTFLVLKTSYTFYNNIDNTCVPMILPSTLSLDTDFETIYNDGVDAGRTEGYGLGYSAGVNAGYSQGYSAGADIGSEDYHIHDLLFTIFDTPFEVLHNLFSFTIFSTPVWTIIVSLLSLLVVLWLIKRLLT